MTGQEKKKTHEDFILKLKEDYLKEYVSDLVKTAEWVLRDLRDYKRKINDEEYLKSCKMEDIARWAMNQAQQVNFHFDNGAQAISEYVEARVRKELSEKENSKDES